MVQQMQLRLAIMRVLVLRHYSWLKQPVLLKSGKQTALLRLGEKFSHMWPKFEENDFVTVGRLIAQSDGLALKHRCTLQNSSGAP